MKKKMSLIFNVLIVIFELIGFFVTYKTIGRISYEYFTEDSNILSFFSSLLYVIFILLNKKIPKYLKIFKYLSTVCMALTFFFFFLILSPMSNYNYVYMLTKDAMLYQHLICPVLCMISFVCFDDIGKLTKKDILYSISFTLLYAVVLIILNIFDFIKGPYPFLMVKEQSIFMSLIWLILIPGLSYLLAVLLKRCNFKYNKDIKWN